jgi:hypothetical protein
MKIKDVPQDHDASYEGAKKLCYALNDEGQFVSTTTDGWQVEEIVKSLAWQEIEKDLRLTSERVARGQASPLEYFMKLRQMDISLLAANMEISYWRVRWHLRPNVFRQLGSEWLLRYSECLDISIEKLREYLGE